MQLKNVTFFTILQSSNACLARYKIYHGRHKVGLETVWNRSAKARRGAR